MIRFLGPKLKLLKNLGISILPNFSQKYILDTKLLKTKGKKTNYFYILKEKQKLRFNYGLTNHRLKKYINRVKNKKGVLVLNLLKLLEMRLDATLVRTGFWNSINQAKQFITHGFIFINKILIKKSNYILEPNDIIHIKSNNIAIRTIIKNNLRTFKYNKNTNFNYQICIKTLKIKIIRNITSKELPLKLNNSLLSHLIY
uniref:30S ribosomal protein S4 n=1 Tax=Nephromyces sp. ex Molgula occidentalis TaxID=2544991 RepID=A0A5C1H8N7_9APIC|nr:30S ribosomal protein S4 [Nephromyces sp. ex Molgula occidentalis]QEM01869.1 30S ribosomal protein S4 [Nephromyces sp. ex Molgula occidentalis]